MAYVPTTGNGSALAAQMRGNLKNFTDWLTANGQAGKGMVGEIGIPGSSNPGVDLNYDPGFTLTLQQWYLDANAQNLHVTIWNAAEWNVDLRAYRNSDGGADTMTYRTTVSSVIETNLASGSVYRGVNITGADFSDTGPGGGLYAGTLYGQYYYPQPGDWTLLASRGITLVRLPIRWERIQPTLKQPLDSTQVGYVTTALGYAAAAGIKVVLDIHNYGRYDTTAATNSTFNNNGVYDLGQNAPGTHNGQAVGGTMISCFVDLWTRLTTQFHNTSGLWSWGICNEPHDLTGNVGTWQEATRQATEAIRLVDQTHHINVGGYNYSGIAPWYANNGSTAWLTETIPAGQTGAGSARNTDPLIIWEGHMYFDYDGTYSGSGSSFTNLNQAAINAGFAAYTNAGGTPVTLDITSQTGDQVLYSSSMDSIYDWTIPTNGSSSSFANSNTVTLPYVSFGNPGNSLQVICTATSDEGAVRRTLTAGNTIRKFSFDFYIPTGATLSTTNNFAIFHGWDQNYVTGTGNNIIELRVLGSGAGYVICVTTPYSTYATTVGTTVLSKGVWNNIKVVMTDTAWSTYLNGSATLDATITASNTGLSMGGLALGKFYGTSYVGTMYYDNAVGSKLSTYDAPPNGGLVVVTPLPPPVNKRGLIGFF
jgi:hypothetical protein